VSIKLTIKITEPGFNDGKSVTAVDRIRMLVCPFLPIPNTRPIEKLYGPSGFGANNPLPVFQQIEALLQSTGDLMTGTLDRLDPPYPYAQDQAEFGWGYNMANKKSMKITLAYMNFSDQLLVPSTYLKANCGYWKGSFEQRRHNNGAMGGNVEVSPPFAGHPFGVTIMGSNGAMGREAINFMRSQIPSSFIDCDISAMPALAHIDEVVSFIPSGQGDDFIVLVADLDLAVDIYAKYPAVKISATETYGNIAEKFRPNGKDGPELTAYRSALNAIAKSLADKVGPNRVVRIPAEPNNKTSGITPNSINLVVLNFDERDKSKTHLLFSKPHSLDDKYQNEIVELFKSPQVGYSKERLHFISPGVLHSGGGGLHCGTNAERKPPPLPVKEIP
jgi:hypothetical protein